MSLPFQAEKTSAGCFFTENIVLFDVVSTSGRFASNERSIRLKRAVDSPQTSGRFSLNERSIQPQREVDSAPSNGQFQKGIKPCLLYVPVHEDFPSFSFPGTHKFRKDVLSHAGYRTHILS